MQGKLSEGDPLLSLHTFSLGGHNYAVEGSSGSAFELNGEVSRALTVLHEASRSTASLPEALQASTTTSALLVEVDNLRERALDLAEGGNRIRWARDHKTPPRTVELCLCATFRCNLSCKYCFVRLGGGSRSSTRRDMTVGTAQAAIDFALGELAPPTCELIVSFGHTGEPLLARELYEEIGDYVHRRAAETNRSIAYGMAATNFTLAGDGVLPKLSWPTVSLDGPREIHDRFRATPAGLGTYDSVVPALKKLLSTSPAEAAETNVVATITGRSTDIRGIFLHLASLHPPFVTLYPARLPPDSELAISEAAAQELLAGYDSLVQHLLALEGSPLTRYLMCMVHGQDYFGRHVLRIALNLRVPRRCDAGVGMYAIAPEGDVFPCPELAALGRMRIGSIQQGLDERVLRQLRSRSVWDMSTCSACWARLLCGGDCLSNRAMYEPFGTPPDPGMCVLTRGLIERAVHLVTRLREAHSEALSTVLEARRRSMIRAALPPVDSNPPSSGV